MNRKLIILIIVAIIILLGISVGLYWAAKKQQETAVVEVKQLQVKKILDEPVVSPVSAFNNNSIWYFNPEGRLFQVSTEGANLSEYPLPSLSGPIRRVLWPKLGQDFIAIGNDANVKTYFKSSSKVFVPLPAGIRFLDWLPDGRRIVYIWQNSAGKNQLVMADADGSGYKVISDVFWPDLAVRASNDGNTALMYRTDVTGDINKIYGANLNTGEITTLVGEGKNIAANWLPVGGKFLFTQSSGNVYLFDMATKQATNLSLITTLDKVAVDASGQNLYAAVTKKEGSGETFVKIDLSTYKSETYFDPPSTVQVKNIFLVGNSVYFTDSRDNKLYTIGE